MRRREFGPSIRFLFSRAPQPSLSRASTRALPAAPPAGPSPAPSPPNGALTRAHHEQHLLRAAALAAPAPRGRPRPRRGDERGDALRHVVQGRRGFVLAGAESAIGAWLVRNGRARRRGASRGGGRGGGGAPGGGLIAQVAGNHPAPSDGAHSRTTGTESVWCPGNRQSGQLTTIGGSKLSAHSQLNPGGGPWCTFWVGGQGRSRVWWWAMVGWGWKRAQGSPQH